MFPWCVRTPTYVLSPPTWRQSLELLVKTKRYNWHLIPRTLRSCGDDHNYRHRIITTKRRDITAPLACANEKNVPARRGPATPEQIPSSSTFGHVPAKRGPCYVIIYLYMPQWRPPVGSLGGLLLRPCLPLPSWTLASWIHGADTADSRAPSAD
eukprot:1192141-Prorocentrum_minimum.AAC.2